MWHSAIGHLSGALGSACWRNHCSRASCRFKHAQWGLTTTALHATTPSAHFTPVTSIWPRSSKLVHVSTVALFSRLTILISSTGLSLRSVLAFSMFSTTSVPLTTRPNTVCLLSSHGVGTVVMKNCSGTSPCQLQCCDIT